MEKLTQVLRNKSDQSIIIGLEYATSRYKLAPGEELLLRYEPKRIEFEHGAPIVIQFENYKEGLGVTIWTDTDELLSPDGEPARMTRD